MNSFYSILLVLLIIATCNGFLPSSFPSIKEASFVVLPAPMSPAPTPTALFGARGGRGLSRKRTNSRPDPTDAMYVYPSVPPCDTTARLLEALEGTGLDYRVEEGEYEKPKWLTELYEGETPAIRHGSEAYIGEGALQFIEFFFKGRKEGEDE